MTAQIFFTKDTKAICPSCKAIIFVFKRDIYGGERANSSDQIYDDKGQAPWKTGERCYCRSCTFEFTHKNLIFEAPNV